MGYFSGEMRPVCHTYTDNNKHTFVKNKKMVKLKGLLKYVLKYVVILRNTMNGVFILCVYFFGINFFKL